MSNRQIKDPETGWWNTIPEPKEDSMLMGFTYSLTVLAGLFTWFTPPLVVEHTIGEQLSILMALFFIIGGALGMVTARSGSHRFERPALYLSMTGWLMMSCILIQSSILGPSIRAPQTAATFITIGLLVWRWWGIRPADSRASKAWRKMRSR